MRPIVDGLQAEYGDEIDVVILNARDGADGQAAFEFYGLRAHPVLVWVEPDGDVGWTRLGALSAEKLETAIEGSLEP